MLTKIIAGIIVWLFVSLIVAGAIGNDGCSFFDDFIAANILLVIAAILILLFDFVLPWAFAALFGGA